MRETRTEPDNVYFYIAIVVMIELIVIISGCFIYDYLHK